MIRKSKASTMKFLHVCFLHIKVEAFLKMVLYSPFFLKFSEKHPTLSHTLQVK